ncbi:MAG TPA: MAPEG family protein [Gammaproteobacteria bacterium]|nr:MAPEG family protein [Gammaproteobacteria bacterium]
MSQELYWLTLVTLFTGLLWLPYILQRFANDGFLPTLLGKGTSNDADWAVRVSKAHKNAVENLVIFAPLVLIVYVTNSATELTAQAAMIYFFARISHALMYALGISILRTFSFLIGVGCQLIFALTFLHLF